MCMWCVYLYADIQLYTRSYICMYMNGACIDKDRRLSFFKQRLMNGRTWGRGIRRKALWIKRLAR